MAAFLACTGRACRVPRSSLCFQAQNIAHRTNRRTLLLSNRQFCCRNYVTVGEAGTPSLTRIRPLSSNRKIGEVNGSNRWRSWIFQGSRCYSSDLSTSSGQSVNETESINPFLQDGSQDSLFDSMTTNSEILRDMADTVTSVGEPSLSSLGLGGYSPIGLIQQGLEFLHVSGDLSWAASIAVATVLVRVICFPIIIKTQIITARLNNIKPEIEELQAKIRELANTYDQAGMGMANMKLKQLYKDHKCHPVMGLFGPMIQIPFFVSFFFGIKRMANLPVESMKTGGYLWFQDLTLFDPYFVLPIICAFSMLASIEMETKIGVGNPAMKSMKAFLRIVTVGSIPIMAQFPAATLLYWVTSNFFTLGQVFLLKIPAVRQGFGIPDIVVHTTAETGSFWENMKAAYKSSEESVKLKHMEKMKRQRQQALGEAPLQPTYEFNPRIKHNQEIFNLQAKKKTKEKQFKDKPGAPM